LGFLGYLNINWGIDNYFLGSSKSLGNNQHACLGKYSALFRGGNINIRRGYKLGKIKRGIDETENKVDRILGIKERLDKLEHEHKLAMDGKLKIAH